MKTALQETGLLNRLGIFLLLRCAELAMWPQLGRFCEGGTNAFAILLLSLSGLAVRPFRPSVAARDVVREVSVSQSLGQLDRRMKKKECNEYGGSLCAYTCTHNC